jgi:hypothetical protein
MISAECGFQQIIRLSFEEETSRDESLGHQLADRMPLECPTSSLTGAKALRRSQTWSTGERSSSEAIIT